MQFMALLTICTKIIRRQIHVDTLKNGSTLSSYIVMTTATALLTQMAGSWPFVHHDAIDTRRVDHFFEID